MKIFIKNMVCDRCCMVVEKTLDEFDLQFQTVRLGEIDFGDVYGNCLDSTLEKKLKLRLEGFGFQFLNNKQGQIIEKIKITCIRMISSSEGENNKKLSQIISRELNREYKYLSTLFSSVEGITIEQFFIRQRVEKAKELLLYDELGVSEIAYRLGYSSVAHLSGQFKKVTGLSPGYFKSMKSDINRSSLDKL